MGDLIYPHHLTINGEPESGGGGIYDSPEMGPPKYDGKCDAQDSGGGFEFTTASGGLQSVSADLRVFLADESKITDIEAGDTGTIKRRGTEQQISVQKVIYIDNSLAVNTVK